LDGEMSNCLGPRIERH